MPPTLTQLRSAARLQATDGRKVTYGEAGADLNLSPDAVRMRVRRMIDRLRRGESDDAKARRAAAYLGRPKLADRVTT